MSVGIRSEAARFAVIRITHLSLLVVLSVALARVLSIHQYALYARGSFFANAFATIMLLGQDQLVVQGRLSMRDLRRRSLVVLLIGALCVIPVAGVSLSRQAFLIVVVSSVGTVGMVLVYGEASLMLARGAYLSRGWLLLLNAVSIQLASVIAALAGGDALAATAAGTAVAWMWYVGVRALGPRGGGVAQTSARFRDGAWIGASAILYGSIPTIVGIVVAIRAQDRTAGEVRFVLLAFSGLVAICSAINTEYFRARLFRARGTDGYSAAAREMVRANWALAAALGVAVPAGALILAVGLGGKYSRAGIGIACLVAVVPLLLSAQVQTNLALVADRTRLPLARNGPAVLVVSAMVAICPASTGGVVLSLVCAEAAGLACFWLVRAMLAGRGTDRTLGNERAAPARELGLGAGREVVVVDGRSSI